jgi:hypothetical protein
MKTRLRLPSPTSRMRQSDGWPPSRSRTTGISASAPASFSESSDAYERDNQNKPVFETTARGVSRAYIEGRRSSTEQATDGAALHGNLGKPESDRFEGL